MGVRLEVPYGVLRRLKQQWDEAGDGLDGSWRRLATASTGGFSPAVAAAVEGFREPWADEVKASARRATGYADEFVLYRRHLQATDVAQAELLRSLLPWEHRDAVIAGG